MENYRTLVSICEDYCKYNVKLALPVIPETYAIKDFRKAKRHETYWDDLHNCATFWPSHYETQGEYLILEKLKKEPKMPEPSKVTIKGLENSTPKTVNTKEIPLNTWFLGRLRYYGLNLFYIPWRSSNAKENEHTTILISADGNTWNNHQNIEDYEPVDIEITVKRRNQ